MCLRSALFVFRWKLGFSLKPKGSWTENGYGNTKETNISHPLIIDSNERENFSHEVAEKNGKFPLFALKINSFMSELELKTT